MITALHTAATGMNAQQMNIDAIANNLANVNTSGFKRSKINFEDLIYQNFAMAGTPSTENTQNPTGLQIGLGVRPSASQKIFTAGAFVQTDNPLDLAIEGDGFFQVTMPDGTVGYTRDGSFKLDGEGNIVTPEGYLVEPNISIPQDATAISVGQDGTVSVLTSGSNEAQEVGKITLARFANPSGLMAVGRNLFKETPASGSPTVGTPGQDGLGSINSGVLEMSNVDVVKEMVEMIRAQRAYQINSRVIRGADEMLGMVADIKR